MVVLARWLAGFWLASQRVSSHPHGNKIGSVIHEYDSSCSNLQQSVCPTPCSSEDCVGSGDPFVTSIVRGSYKAVCSANGKIMFHMYTHSRGTNEQCRSEPAAGLLENRSNHAVQECFDSGLADESGQKIYLRIDCLAHDIFEDEDETITKSAGIEVGLLVGIIVGSGAALVCCCGIIGGILFLILMNERKNMPAV